MRSLYARRLHLWPRFHMAVSAELEQTQPQVEELTAPLSAKGQLLQRALLEAVDSSLKELRSFNKVRAIASRAFDQGAGWDGGGDVTCRMRHAHRPRRMAHAHRLRATRTLLPLAARRAFRPWTSRS